MVEDYSEFIEWWLNEQKLEYISYDDYFHCQSIFTEDNNPSVSFYRTGYYHIYNSTVTIKDKDKTRLTIKEIMLLSGYLKEFIHWVIPFYGIKNYDINKFRQLEHDLFLSVEQTRELNELKKKLSPLWKEEFISIKEILSIEYLKRNATISKTYKKKKVKKTYLELVDMTDSELYIAMEYLLKRKLKRVDNVTYPATVSINNIYRKPCIASQYPCGALKLRLITDNKKMRFLSIGRARSLFESRTNYKDILIITEGELNANILSQIELPFDVKAMSNCNTMRINNSLDSYTKIIIMVDLEELENNKKKLEQNFAEWYFGDLEIIPFFKKVNPKKKGYDVNDFVMEYGFDKLKEYLISYLQLEKEVIYGND